MSTGPTPNPAAQEPVHIPDKLYFRIGDVSRITGIKAYVLRYWESEFPALAPKKSGTNQRLYRRKDVEMVLEIKHLLYEKRFTIEGARAFLQNKGTQQKSQQARSGGKASRQSQPKQVNLFGSEPADLAPVRDELKAILALLESGR